MTHPIENTVEASIKDSDIADYLGARARTHKNWFDPLYDIVPVHPYVAEET